MNVCSGCNKWFIAIVTSGSLQSSVLNLLVTGNEDHFLLSEFKWLDEVTLEKLEWPVYIVKNNDILWSLLRLISEHFMHNQVWLELDRCIGSTHHRGRLWDNRNNRQSMTIGEQSMPIFHDDVTHQIHLAMGFHK